MKDLKREKNHFEEQNLPGPNQTGLDIQTWISQASNIKIEQFRNPHSSIHTRIQC